MEAIIAMVLVGSVGVALFSWVYSSTNAVYRIEAANARNMAMAEGIEYMQRVNPMDQPEGEADFGTYRVVWQAVPLTERIDGMNYPKGQGLFEFALYSVDLTGKKIDDEEWFQFRMKLVGYKKTRVMQNPFGVPPAGTP